MLRKAPTTRAATVQGGLTVLGPSVHMVHHLEFTEVELPISPDSGWELLTNAAASGDVSLTEALKAILVFIAHRE